MITFLAPGFLIAAGVAAAAVAGLHFLVTRTPQIEILPTARFVPRARMRSTVLAFKLTDVLLLLLRIAILLLLGIALAQPNFALPKEKLHNIVVLDVSRAVRKSDAWRALARKHASNAAAVIVFDSSARELQADELDAALSAASSARGSLSVALIAALRAAAHWRDRAESLELIVISPLAMEERDAATLSIRSLWPGRISLVRTEPALPPVMASGSATARSKVARLEWADAAESHFWIERSRSDAIGGIRSGDATMIFPFQRRWQLKPFAAPGVRVIARWIDGEPAAIELMTDDDATCLRSIGFSLPTIGDAALRAHFVRFTDSLSAPCGDRPDLRPLPQPFVSELAGQGEMASSASIRSKVRRLTSTALWLLIAALALLMLELALRRWSARCRSGA